MSRRDDGPDDWRARIIPGHQEAPRSVKALLGMTAFVAQTTIGLVLTENASFFLNRPTLTIVGVAALVISILFWVAIDIGEGIEREREERRRGQRREDIQRELEIRERLLGDEGNVEDIPSDRDGPLTLGQRLKVENIVMRHIQRRESENDTSDVIIADINDLDDLDVTDPELQEQVEENQAELTRVKESVITEERIREIVAESLDGVADSQEITQVSDEIKSQIDKLESRTDDLDSSVEYNQKQLKLLYKYVKQRVDDFEPAPSEETEQSSKKQEDAPRSQDIETDEREPEFEK